MGFEDRREAGRQLARLLHRAADESVVVLAVARGGVLVGSPVAQQLRAPLEALVVRKLVAPGDPERTLGALAEGGVLITEERFPSSGAPLPPDLEAARNREQAEVERRIRLYRGDRPLPVLIGRTAIIVDDGVATGMTCRAAIAAARRLQPARLVLAVPLGSVEVVAHLRAVVDELVCVETRLAQWAIGLSYTDFSPVDDTDVLAALGAAAGEPSSVASHT